MIMKKLFFLFPIFVCAAFLNQNVSAQNVVKVDNALALMNAIQSNTTIELAPGTYNISKVMSEIKNDQIILVDNFDGFEPNIHEISDLTIKGGGKATILLEPRYAWVMMFINCSNITLDGITFGHTESGYCMGGVLGFESCYTVSILNCSLYGSGTVGIMANSCTNLLVKKSDIHDCTYGLAYIYNSTNVNFQTTKFRNTGEFNLIEIMGSNEVSFSKCIFTDNFTNEYMPYMFSVDENIWTGVVEDESKSTKILISKCSFKNNNASMFVNIMDRVTIEACKFKDNAFDEK
jgi:hypothetical protein